MATRKDVLQIVLEKNDDGSVRASLASTGEQLDGIENKADRANSATKTLQRTLGVFAGAVGAGIAINTIAEFERLEITLNNLGVSFDEVKKITSNVPFQLSEMADGAIKLKAFGLDPLDGTMQALIDQSANLGGSQETLNGIILAVGQAWAKQKLQGEEILQLVERGVPVWEILQKTTGKNVQQLQKLSEQGKLGREAIRGLIDEMGKANFGAAADQMDTVGGAISNLKDSADQLIASLGEAGLSDIIKASAGLLSELATGVRENKEEFISLVAVIAAMKLAPLAVSAGVAAKGMLTAASGARVLSTALAFLGGPAGIIAGAATALGLWVFSSDDAVSSTGELTDRVDALLGKFDDLKARKLEDTLEDITEKMQEQADAIQRIKDNAAISSAPLAGNEIFQINAITQSLIELGEQYGKIQDKLREINNQTNTNTSVDVETQYDKEYEKYVNNLTRRIVALRESQASEYEQIGLAEEQKKLLIEDAYTIGLIDYSEYEEAKTALTIKAEKDRQAIVQRGVQTEINVRRGAVHAATGLLQALGRENKAAAVAAILVTKGLAIAQTLAHTQTAATLAYASQLVPGDPTSIARAEAARARVLSLGAITAGLIGATGAVEISQLGDSGSSLGSPSNPVNTTNNTPTFEPQQEQQSRVIYNVNVYGDTYGVDDLDTTIASSIRRTIDNDGTIIEPGTRQALNLQQAG